MTVFADEGVLAEVHLRIDGRSLLLIAGELAETPAGTLLFTGHQATTSLLFHRLNESVLACTDPAAVERAPVDHVSP